MIARFMLVFALVDSIVNGSTNNLAAATAAFGRGVIKAPTSPATTVSGVFGIPRGGGLFGSKKNEDKKAAAKGVSTTMPGDDGDDSTMYPAMTQQEVEDWLEHIPVFAVTDKKGQSIILRPDDETSVCYFFMSPIMANQTLNQLRNATIANEDGEDEGGTDLQVSAFSLGKIWFQLLSDPKKKAILQEPGAGEEAETTTESNVEYRLVPDMRDLMGARMLLTMNPDDGEKLKSGEQQMTPEYAQAAIKKAMTESPKFNSTYNEIPVFTIAQMRMQRQRQGDEPSKGNNEEEGETFLPMYFSLQNMVATWQQFMVNAPDDVKGMEPSINLMSLEDLIAMMLKESTIDFRSVLLIPPSPRDQQVSAAAASPSPEESMESVMSGGGTSLGDL